MISDKSANNLYSAAILIALVIFLFFLSMFINRYTAYTFQGSVVVDKYRNAWDFPKLSVEKDGEYASIFVSENEYYDYEIGEEYKPESDY